MADERFDIEAVFFTARQMPSQDRAAYLDQVCGNDPALRQRVEQLLHAQVEIGSFLESPAPELDATRDSPSVTEAAGTMIGPYKLLQQIGEGGMGTVYMAEQMEPVKRKVALKVIKPGMDSRQVVARFEAERQALAMMDHVNIARVFDGGATENGRPYFVMELVHGVPITKYCDDNHLTPRQRLELFVPVCQAIQHAHQKGIIHRDIKPSNVMVTLYDGKPVPKVIDFGVAKATEQKLTERTLFTQYGTMVGTLEYMSPEQAEMSALGVDTRSDIYSLGVLLYELLTGSTPLTHKRMKEAAYGEILRLIKEEEPPKPSTRLSDSGEALASISAQRKTEPAKLTKLVRGELDWIVMKTLEKDRNRRYETANGIAADVQRYLNDEPVQACPPSAVYRLKKFARRNKGPVAAVGLVLLALVGGIAGTTWGLLRAEQQRQVAEAKKQEAVDERDAKDAALKAEQQARADEAKARRQAFAALRSMTTGVVEKKFSQGTALTEDDRAFLRGVITQFDAFAALKADDADSRALRAEGRRRVAYMRYVLGELKEAEQGYDQAMSLYEQLAADFPSRPEFRYELANSHNGLGNLRRALGRLPEALKEFEQSLSLLKQLAAEHPSKVEYRRFLAGSRLNRGNALHDLGRLAEAEKEYSEALTLWKQMAGDFPSEADYREGLAFGYNTRGVLFRKLERLQEAKRDCDQAVSLYMQLAGDFPSWSHCRHILAASYNNRGLLLRSMRQQREAEQDYDQAISLQKQLVADFPSRHEYRIHLSMILNNRGDLLRDTGRRKEAEQDLDQAFSLQTQLAANFPSLAENRRLLAGSHIKRGDLFRDQGRLAEAEKEYNAALSIRKKLAAERSSEPDLQDDLAGDYLRAALLQKQLGNCAAAKRLLQEARPHRLTALKAIPGHPFYRRGYRTQLEQLIEIQARLLDSEDAVGAAETYRDLGWDTVNDAYNAACFLARCIPGVTKHDKLDDRQRQNAARFYGDAVMKLLREAVGRGYRNAAHMLKDADLDPLRQREDFDKLITDLNPPASARASSYVRLGQWDKAAAVYAKAIELKPDDHQAINELAWLYATCHDPQFRRPREAVALAEKAIAGATQDANYWNTLGAARYRAGDWPGAVAALQKFRELRTSDVEWSNPFFLAMAHWRLGNADEAGRWRDRAVAWMESRAPKNENLRRYRMEMEEVMREKPGPGQSEKRPG